MKYHVFRNQVSPGPVPHGTWSVPRIEGHFETCGCDKCRGIDDIFTRVIARGVSYNEAVRIVKAESEAGPKIAPH